MENTTIKWNKDKAVEWSHDEGQQYLDNMLMEAAGNAPTVEEAVQRLTQKPDSTNETEESINISVSQSLLQKIDTLATSLGLKRNDIIKQALTQQLA